MPLLLKVPATAEAMSPLRQPLCTCAVEIPGHMDFFYLNCEGWARDKPLTWSACPPPHTSEKGAFFVCTAGLQHCKGPRPDMGGSNALARAGGVVAVGFRAALVSAMPGVSFHSGPAPQTFAYSGCTAGLTSLTSSRSDVHGPVECVIAMGSNLVGEHVCMGALAAYACAPPRMGGVLAIVIVIVPVLACTIKCKPTLEPALHCLFQQ